MSPLKQSRLAVLTLTTLVVLSSPMAAQTARTPEAAAAYQAGLDHLAQEQWDQAIASFNQAISADEADAEAFLGRADALLALEDYRAAMESYADAVARDESLARGYNGRGVCERELGEIELAANDFHTAYGLDRNDPEIAANYGDLLINRFGDGNSALRILDKAIELDPENAEVFGNRGLAHAQIGEYDEALEDLNRSLELDPTSYRTYNTVATIHLTQKEYAEAIDAYAKAIEYYEPLVSQDPPIFVEGYLQRTNAALALATKDETSPERREELYQAVIADTDAVLEEFPETYPVSGSAMYVRGKALRLQERFGFAIKALTDAIQLAPIGTEGGYLADAYLRRGICWHYHGQDSLARGDFEEAAGLQPEDPLPHLWIGYTYAQEEDYRRAIESYGNAIAKYPAFPLPYVNRGLAYMQLDEFNKAVDNFNQAIRNEPTEPEHYYKRGVAHMRLEEYQKAYDSFFLALQYDKEMRKALLAAAKALRGLGREELAEEYDRRANAVQPSVE